MARSARHEFKSLPWHLNLMSDSVGFRYGSCTGRFGRFLWGKVSLCLHTVEQTGTVPVPEKRFQRCSGWGSWENGWENGSDEVLVLFAVPEKMVPTVPVPSSSLVRAPPLALSVEPSCWSLMAFLCRSVPTLARNSENLQQSGSGSGGMHTHYSQEQIIEQPAHSGRCRPQSASVARSRGNLDVGSGHRMFKTLVAHN